MNKFHYIFHFIFYYVAWIGCMLLAAHEHGLLAALLVFVLVLVQLFWQHVRKQTKGLYVLIVLLTVAGSCIDTLLLKSGYINFSANIFSPYFTPPWMMMIWVSFSVILFSTLSSLFKYHFSLGLLSFVGFAFAYSMGVKMGAAAFPHGYLTCLLIGLIWAFMLPLFIYAYQRIMKAND